MSKIRFTVYEVREIQVSFSSMASLSHGQLQTHGLYVACGQVFREIKFPSVLTV